MASDVQIAINRLQHTFLNFFKNSIMDLCYPTKGLELSFVAVGAISILTNF